MHTTYQWGWFQSVAQLSVALNAAFASLATFLGNNLKREEVKIRALISHLEARNIASPGNQKLTLTTELRLLSGRALKIERRYHNFSDMFVRPLCILGMLGGLFALLYSSFNDPLCMTLISVILTISTAVPFIIGVFTTVLVSALLTLLISRQRIKIDNACR